MWEKHAIQIETVNTLKLSIERNSDYADDHKTENNFMMHCATTDYDSDSKIIGVKLSVYIGYDEEKNKIQDSEFWLEVVLEGIFSVDEEKFPLDKIDIWAQQNAPLILYPYAREASFSLTNRVLEDSAAILPLLTVPTIKK